MFKIEKLDFLISLYILCLVVSELMGGKTFSLLTFGTFHLNASVALFVIPIIFSINDIITEVHGAARARSMVRSGLIMIALLSLFATLAISLPPSTRFKESESAYDTIFGQSLRISLASLAAFAFSDLLDIFIFQKLKEKLGKKALWLRNNVSNIISQFIDSTVFMFLAFYALDRSTSSNLSFLFGLITPYWLLRCGMSIIETPFVYMGVKWLKSEK